MARLLELHISLLGVTKPEVWRDIVIPSTMTFDDLHNAIQCVMGWENMHLYQFQDKRHMYENIELCIKEPMEGDEELSYKIIDSRKKTLGSYFNHLGAQLYYCYDLGDEWVHEITLEGRFNTDPVVTCIDGEGACPPEDVGGPPMYQEMKRLFEEEPGADVTFSYRDWLGLEDEDWDEYEFSEEEAQRRLDVWYRQYHGRKRRRPNTHR